MVQRELALTMQEVAECRAQAELFELEANGFFGIEVLLFLYAILTMHVLIEEWYVPALELVTSPDVLDVPRPLLGCTIMAAGNCLPELSMSLVAMLLSGSPDVGTGEVFGSCVFDLLAILGVVCVRMPAPATPTAETPQLARPLMFYFLFWAALATAIDASLFYADLTAMWPLSILMVVLFVTFVVGVFVCNRLIPNFAAPDLSLPQVGAPPVEVAPTATGSADGGALVVREKGYGSSQPADSTAPLSLPSPPPSPTASTALVAPPSTALATAPPGGLVAATADEPTAATPAALLPAPKESTPLLLPPPPAAATATPATPPAPADARPDAASPHAGAAKTDDGDDTGPRHAVARLFDRIFDFLAVPPRTLFRFSVPSPTRPMQILGGRRPWALTILLCILFTLMLSYAMVAIATRAVCLLGVRKNALGATVLCLSAGFPDLLTAMILVRRPGPGMVEMAAANPFGALLFNAFVALGLPWLILGTYADVFPPARGTWLPSLVGFVCIAIGLVLILAARLKLSRRLGYALLTLYALYVVAIVHDGTTRPARPPA